MAQVLGEYCLIDVQINNFTKNLRGFQNLGGLTPSIFLKVYRDRNGSYGVPPNFRNLIKLRKRNGHY